MEYVCPTTAVMILFIYTALTYRCNMAKKDTVNSVLPHTEAKLQFYTYYLARYLEILIRASNIDKINIYDMLCGEGIYSDGKTGSAVRAVNAVWEAQASNKTNKTVNLHLNDLDNQKILKLKGILQKRNSEEKNFSISYSTEEAFELLDSLCARFIKQPTAVRNLIFIDPYGYKCIKKESLISAIENRKTELIVWLPIEQMYRFRHMTSGDEVESSYRALKEFVDQFGLDVTSINSEKEFIQSLAPKLKFNDNLFATSYAIKNHTGHYYGMFFITPSIKGLEKINEVKWSLDSQQGEESDLLQFDFFLESDKQSDLETQLHRLLAQSERTNNELYEFVLNLGFLPKHGNGIFRNWQNDGILQVYDLEKEKTARKGTFKLTYDSYKTGRPQLRFSLMETNK